MFQDVETTKLLGSLSGDLYSHPHRLLKEHLEGTAKLALRLATVHGLEVDQKLLQIICETHDLGKADPAWQRHLFDKNAPQVEHALPSACFTLDITRDLWAAEVVRRHHTHLENLRETYQFWLRQDNRFKEFKNTLKNALPTWNCSFTEDEWKKFTLTLEDLLLIPQDDASTWLSYRSFYSLLVAADRMDAIGVSDLDFSPLPNFALPDFSKREPTPLDGWRKEIREKCLQQASGIESPGIYTLTLPTGSGKTLIGLEIARLLAEKFDYKTIIYALPFISIIEQNASLAKEIFGRDSVQEDHSQTLEKPNNNNHEQNPWERMSPLFRYWRSPVVLTTMVQFWDAIFDPKATASMNFHRLAHSVVILDEPQGIAPNLWSDFGKTLSFISQKWGTTFILMTATQPHIGEGKELAPLKHNFPFNRHQYQIIPQKQPISKLVDILLDNLPVKKGSGLIVMNTKKSALLAFKMLKEILDAPVLFLSTWMTPHHRKLTMRLLKYLERKRIRHYLISTQVVEAGVDLDFDWVFRDIGPLESIIQVAGRCNRHMKQSSQGKVLVVELVDENGRSFCNTVYDDILITKSRDILYSKTFFKENDTLNIINEYYNDILSNLQYDMMWDDIKSGNWSNKKNLIRDEKNLVRDKIRDETEYFTKKVFIESNRNIKQIISLIKNENWNLENIYEKKQLLKIIGQYSIDIPNKEIEKWRYKLAPLPTKDNMPLLGEYEDTYWIMTREAMKYAYNKITGFVPSDFELGRELNESFI